jgi:Tfp pilus assembly protein PilF
MKRSALFYTFFLITGILFTPVFLSAQESANKKAQQNFEYAQKSLQNRDYDTAAKMLDDAVAADPGFDPAR